MANGRLRCLGSAQHLKTKFGQGFQVEINVKEAREGDPDFIAHANVLARTRGATVDGESGLSSQNVSFTLSQVISGLNKITNNIFLSSKISADNPLGYNIWKSASSPAGTSLTELAIFATNELRMKKINDFMSTSFPKHALRERQNNKVRYEVSNDSIRISDIFSLIEESKEALAVSEYGASQTSLEQVFNYHAAEAEVLKRD